jgi:hypothetical protein
VTAAGILWRRLDVPGCEAARLEPVEPMWQLSGTAVFAHDGRPCRLDYRVRCDAGWRTRDATVTGWVGDALVDVELRAGDAGGGWRLNGQVVPAVAGCIDVDLNFSPSTNLLPIRRLALAVGGEAAVRAAWLRFPDFTLEPLPQLYRRVETHRYDYESAGGRFRTELTVDEAGFVTEYPGFWSAAAGL